MTVRLPLFPLNSVLFPGLVLPLNIFEERYRAMMRELLKTPEEDPRRFAVVAIRDGHEVAVAAPGMPDPTAVPERGPAAGFGPDPLAAFHSVGCVTPTKQRLLQAPDTASRLRDELKLLRAETSIIRSLPSLPASDLTRGPTSLN